LTAVKTGFFYSSYAISSIAVILIVFALYLMPDNKTLTLITTVIASLAVLVITGAMIAELIFRAQSTAFAPAVDTSTSKFGEWLLKFGLGGVLTFAMGAFGCWAIMFGVEMLLKRVKNQSHEPFVLGFAVPANTLYKLGAINLQFFQNLLKLALLIRLMLAVIGYFFPQYASL
jgi:hypothetical protein